MPTNSALRYLLASLALGAISVWGSEVFFWTAPREPVDVLDLVLTLAAYSLAAAAALSAVLWTGASGWRAAFLGGCILGWLVEGVIVTTTYDAFPVQLIWTPMAWHGVITGGVLIGAWRAARGNPAAMATMVAGLATFGVLWGLYWPLERDMLPGWPEVTTYLLGLGLLVPLGHFILDRLGHLARPSPGVLAVAPVFVALLWAIQLAIRLDLRMLALPVVIGLAVMLMYSLGGGGNGVLDLHAGKRPMHNAALLLVPLAMALTLPLLWPLTRGLPTNVPIALATSLASVLAVFALAWRGFRRWGIVRP